VSRLATLALLAATTFFAVACPAPDDGGDDPVIDPKNHATIDGVVVGFGVGPQAITISGNANVWSAASLDNALQLNVGAPATVSTYACGNSSGDAAMSISPGAAGDESASDFLTDTAGGSCTVTVTSVAAVAGDHFAGTYSGTLVNGDGEQRVLEDGVFDAALTTGD
jgi:hypothetical protein